MVRLVADKGNHELDKSHPFFIDVKHDLAGLVADKGKHELVKFHPLVSDKGEGFFPHILSLYEITIFSLD